VIPIFTSLIAILLPIFILYRYQNNHPVKRAYLYSIGSFTSALIALCLEVITIRRRVFSGDFGGIEDTIGAVLMICIGITVVTVLLNLLALAGAYTDKKGSLS